MSSRKIEDLHPEAQIAFLKFESILEANKLQFVRACTYRSDQEQQKLYNQGRTTLGPKITYARPGESKHNNTLSGKPASLAADYCPLINGKLADRKTDEELRLWRIMAQAANQVGLIWGGDWKEPKTDFTHFEYPLITNKKPQPEKPNLETELAERLKRIDAQLEKIGLAVDQMQAAFNKMTGA